MLCNVFKIMHLALSLFIVIDRVRKKEDALVVHLMHLS